MRYVYTLAPVLGNLPRFPKIVGFPHLHAALRVTRRRMPPAKQTGQPAGHPVPREEGVRLTCSLAPPLRLPQRRTSHDEVATMTDDDYARLARLLDEAAREHRKLATVSGDPVERYQARVDADFFTAALNAANEHGTKTGGGPEWR